MFQQPAGQGDQGRDGDGGSAPQQLSQQHQQLPGIEDGEWWDSLLPLFEDLPDVPEPQQATVASGQPYTMAPAPANGTYHYGARHIAMLKWRQLCLSH